MDHRAQSCTASSTDTQLHLAGTQDGAQRSKDEAAAGTLLPTAWRYFAMTP